MTCQYASIRIGLALGVLVTAACASLPVATSPSLVAFSALQARERAGLYGDDWVVDGDSRAIELHRLESWASQRGIFVLSAPLGRKNLLGHVSHSGYVGWVVLLNESLSVNNRLYTLLHELAHVYGPDGTDEAREVVAEMVAASVCARIGLDVWPQTAAYLAANVAPEVQARAVQRYGEDIDRIIERLTLAVQEPK